MLQSYTPRMARVPLRKSLKTRVIIVAVVLAVLIIVFVVLFTAVLPRAEVIVIPETVDQTVSVTTLLDNRLSATKLDPLTLPARVVGVEVSSRKAIEARTQKDLGTHAKGVIKFMNRTGAPYDVLPEIGLRAPNNLEYTVTQALTVPAATVSAEGEIVLGSSLAEVIARDAGERANVLSGRLLISGFDAGRADTHYAEIQSPGLTGGTSRIETVVGDGDLNASVSSMREELRRELFEKYRSQLTTEELLPEELLKIDELVSTDPALGQKAHQFQLTLTLKSAGLAFKIPDLATVLSDEVMKMGNGGHVVSSGVKDATFIVEQFDPSKGSAKIKATSTVRIGDELNRETLVAEIVGKRIPEARRALLAHEGVKDVRLIIRRSLNNKIPQDLEKINLIVGY